MNKFGGLACPACGAELETNISYDGCDWNSQAGGGSGFDWEITLACTRCSRLFPVGRVKRLVDFSENKEMYIGSLQLEKA